MKILLDSHSTVTQNGSGGLQVRISEHFKSLQEKGISCKLFNKWEDKIEEYDIFHVFKVTKDSYNEILYAKQKNKKVVISAVIPLLGEKNIKISLLLASLLKLSLPHEFIRKSLALADVITVQTESEKRFIIYNYKISNKIIVIPNGISSRFTDENKLSVSFSDVYGLSKPFVLQVGRFDTNKNQLNVIKALKGIDIPVVFIGGPFLNERDYYEQCALNLDDNMKMTGWIDHKSDLVLSAYREAKVVVLPSFYETFGNVLIEAGSSGANIACSETLPINEYEISKYWSKFDPNNSISIKEKILKEYTKSYNNEMKKEFVSTFRWNNVILQYITLYRNLLS